jgi:hypothetical protein
MVALVVWCIFAIVYIRPPATCKPLRGFLLEALALQSTIILLIVIALVFLLASHPMITRLNDLIARGAVLSEASGLVAEVDPNDAPAKEECVICLGCMEDEDSDSDDRGPASSIDAGPGLEIRECGGLGLDVDHCEDDLETGLAATGNCSAVSKTKARPPWRRLRCGHRFHETCLFTWLRKVKRCPICRSHMREVPAWQRAQLAQAAETAAASASSEVERARHTRAHTI